MIIKISQKTVAPVAGSDSTARQADEGLSLPQSISLTNSSENERGRVLPPTSSIKDAPENVVLTKDSLTQSPLGLLSVDLQARVLAFLPMKELCDTVCQTAKPLDTPASMVAQQKLNNIGITLSSEGPKTLSFEQCQTSAHAFVLQNQSILQEFEAARSEALNRERNQGTGAAPVYVNYVPLTSGRQCIKDLNALADLKNLTEKYSQEDTDVNGNTVTLGVNLSRSRLRVIIPIARYISELQQQRASLSTAQFGQRQYQLMTSALEGRIQKAQNYAEEGKKTIISSYLPKLGPTQDSSTAYEEFARTTAQPLKENAITLQGLAPSDQRVIGLNLRHTNLVVAIPKDSFETVYQSGEQLIDHHRNENLEKFQNL